MVVINKAPLFDGDLSIRSRTALRFASSRAAGTGEYVVMPSLTNGFPVAELRPRAMCQCYGRTNLVGGLSVMT